MLSLMLSRLSLITSKHSKHETAKNQSSDWFFAVYPSYLPVYEKDADVLRLCARSHRASIEAFLLIIQLPVSVSISSGVAMICNGRLIEADVTCTASPCINLS